ncbi:MAG TPA: fumarylacetoacetate hydrolase family protein [candidate division Zixibacteria bacterium]|nr:fumarylacetoacetate hydrolase family protein [candidate division Zixibacteria bacterium]
MKVSVRLHHNSPRVCVDTGKGTYDVGVFSSILAESSHSLKHNTHNALSLKNIELDPDNFISSEGALESLQKVKILLSDFLENKDPGLLELAKVDKNAPFFPPIRKPPLMYGLAGNCPQTWRQAGTLIPNYPVGYTRPWKSLSSHKGRVLLDENVTSFRCAVELGVVIGREAFQVSKAEALDYVYGYVCVNDMISNHWKAFTEVSSPNGNPDFKELLITSYYGRGTDGFAPVGPYIISKGDVGDPYNLMMFTRQNGVQRDRSYTNAMVVGIENTIEYLSRSITLYPGSIIHMGTMGIDGITIPEDIKLGHDDFVEVEIEKIGILRTYFEDRRKSAK